MLLVDLCHHVIHSAEVSLLILAVETGVTHRSFPNQATRGRVRVQPRFTFLLFIPFSCQQLIKNETIHLVASYSLMFVVPERVSHPPPF